MAVLQSNAGIIFNTRAGGDSDVVSVLYAKAYDAGCFGHRSICVVRTKKFLHQKDRVKVRVGVSMLQFDTIQSYPVHLRWILGRNMG